MTKKSDNTLLWVGALALGGYLLYEHQKNAAAANATATTVLPVAAPPAVLQLPPSSALSSAAPASNMTAASASPAASGAINTTNLVPVPISANGEALLQPGQGIALDSTGSPILVNGQPMMFGPAAAGFADPDSLAAQKWGRIDLMEITESEV